MSGINLYVLCVIQLLTVVVASFLPRIRFSASRVIAGIGLVTVAIWLASVTCCIEVLDRNINRTADEKARLRQLSRER